MPFKIVQTIENSEICLTIVPSLWEEDNILYWPKKTQATKLQKQEYSAPDKLYWEKMICVKKRELKTYKEAKQELSAMEGKSETEIDNEALGSSSRRKVANANKLDTSIMNFNSLLSPEILQQSDKNLDLQHQSGIIILQNDILTPQQEVTETETPHQYDFINYNNNNSENLTMDVNNATIETILKNQEYMMSELKKLKTSFDTLIGMIDKCLPTTQPVHIIDKPTDTLQVLSDPINTEEKLKKLEEQLRDDKYLQKIIESMTFICGKSGKEKGINVCYKLIDYFLDREFVDRCSWTGNTKGQASKVALKYFVNFRKCFLNIVRLADNDFSEIDCENFFKRILKNSCQRKNAKKITSSQKRKPKNLQYKKKGINENVSAITLEEEDNEKEEREENHTGEDCFSEGDKADDEEDDGE